MNLSNKRYGDTDEPRWLADTVGETSEAIALHEWSATPLGPLARWPQSLRTAVGICLGSRFPMALWWGNELIQIYNDAYRHILGDKHPRSLGQNASACWAEIWNTVGPMAANVMATGEATWFEDLLLVINRFGYIEEAYFTVSYSSVRAESGAVAGVLMTCVETTERVLGERRLATLRDLAAHSGDGKTAEEAADIAANILAANPFDVPFALLYLIDAPGKVARLAGWVRLPPSWPAAPAAIALDESAGAAPLWPLGDALRTERPLRVDLSSAQLQNLPGGQWPEAPQTALILPIPGGSQGTAGALVIGISPRRALDEAYRGFCELIARQIGTSVTHARAYQEERRRAEALAEIDRRKAEFLANMSHEIRSPMTSILGYADVLLAHLKNPDNIECVKTIKQSGNYLLEIINDILDLSKIESGKLQVGKEWLSLPTLLAEIHALMAVRANEKHLPLILKYDGAVPEMIESDRTRLRQILINLISNAIKFTDHGKVEIVTQFLAPQNVLRIEVRDTGIGISAEQQQRLFLPFTQADSSLARAHGGTGLGLAITKRLVDMLGGNISFETRENFGTTFRVEIPSGPMDGTRRAGAGAQWSSRTAGAAGARLDCRVLAVDDRREIQYLIRHFLEEAGAEVTTVSDGYGAIAAVKDGAYDVRPFDIVIMDIQMPGLDGYQTTRQMRTQGFSKPIIGLSAGAMKGDREKCLEAGCNDYLSKPIDAEALVKLVAQHIAQTSSEVPMIERSRQKILLVDDHQVACKSTAILLEMAGHEVRTAFNGRTALEIARDFSADVVILDIGLPDIGGYELLSRLKQYDQLAGAKFIALTGYEEESARRDDLGVDFHHFLRKPVDTSQLKALLQDC